MKSMTKKLRNSGWVAVLALAAVGAVTAFAESSNSKPGSGPNGPTHPISWHELVARCKNPKGFNLGEQFALDNLRVQCSDSRITWIAASPGEVSLPGKRTVTTAVFADKVHVGAEQRQFPIFSKSGSCHRFKEVEESLTVERAVTCDEILGKINDPADLCVGALDASKGANPKLVDVTDTGRMIDTCGGGATQHNGKGGGKS